MSKIHSTSDNSKVSPLHSAYSRAPEFRISVSNSNLSSHQASCPILEHYLPIVEGEGSSCRQSRQRGNIQTLSTRWNFLRQDLVRHEFGRKGLKMNGRRLDDLQSLPACCKCFTIYVLAFCVFFLGRQVLAQQIESGVTLKQKGAGVATVAQNAGRGATKLYGQQDQASLPDAPSASQPAYAKPGPLTLGARFKIYRGALIRPYTLVGPALGAGVGQWEDEPPEWGQGGEGYARRLASGMGRHVIAETIRFGLAAADGEDPRYQRSRERGVWSRTRHAIVETFTSETESGTRIPAYSRLAGAYGAAFISSAWYPDSRATVGYALRRGSTALASSLGFHLFEEFVPAKYFRALHVGD